MATPAGVSCPSDEGPLDWHDRAACKGADLDIFFPAEKQGTPEYDAAVLIAKRICAWCPVKQDCLEWSIRELGVGTANDDLGIYGGKTMAERRSYHRQRLTAARRRHRG